MADGDKNLDTNEIFHSALDSLMNNLHIDSKSSLDSSCCTNSFTRHFNTVDEDKFFSFCSTINRCSKSDNVNKIKGKNSNRTPTPNARETPKRSVTTIRKQKLFAQPESPDAFKPKSGSALGEKELSPKSLLLKKAITRFECKERRKEKMALSKKPVRTSLRV